jgi:hypothetical protein
MEVHAMKLMCPECYEISEQDPLAGSILGHVEHHCVGSGCGVLIQADFPIKLRDPTTGGITWDSPKPCDHDQSDPAAVVPTLVVMVPGVDLEKLKKRTRKTLRPRRS